MPHDASIPSSGGCSSSGAGYPGSCSGGGGGGGHHGSSSSGVRQLSSVARPPSTTLDAGSPDADVAALRCSAVQGSSAALRLDTATESSSCSTACHSLVI